MRATGKAGQTGWVSAHHSEAGLPAVERRAACTDLPRSPQVSPQLYSLLSPRGMPPKSDGETAIFEQECRKTVKHVVRTQVTPFLELC